MSLVIIGMMSSIEIYRWRKWAGIIYAIIVLSVIPQITTLHPRVSSLTLSSDLRYCYWKAASELIQEKPILGYGMSHAQEEFDNLPPLIQKIVVSPNQLSEWGRCDIEEVNTVIQSNFMRSYKAKSSQQKTFNRLPSDVKQQIALEMN